MSEYLLPPPKKEISSDIGLLPLPPKIVLLGGEYTNLAPPRKPTKKQKGKIDDTIDRLKDISDEEIKAVYDGMEASIFLPTFKEYAKTFFNIIKDETKIKADFKAFKNSSVWERFMQNSTQFAAAKSVAQNKMLKELLFDDKGVRRGYSEFKRDAKAVTDVFNETWLRVEYDSSIRQAVSGDMFRAFKDDADIYNFWQYLETTSANPRDSHLALVGNIYRIGDPEGDAVFPPNGFNCLPSGSLIKTPKGWEQIQNLQLNQTIIGGSGNECDISFIHKNFFNGQIIGIVSKGKQVFYTKNHRILTIKGWVQSDSINVGDIMIDFRKKGILNAMICYINNCYIFGRNKTVSFVIKWQSRMMESLNSNVKVWYKNINPIFTAIEIVNRIKRSKIFQNQQFVFSRFSPSIDMQFGISGIHSSNSFNKFSLNFGAKGGGTNFKFFRNNPKMFAIFFSLTKIRMRGFCNILSHSLTCLLFPIICIYPLYLYTLGSITNWYIKHSENFGKYSIITNTPFFRKFVNRFVLNDIKFIQDNGDAAPLNFFDSGYMALYSIFCHNKLVVIEDVNIQNHNDYVYNLTIEKDVSYITETGIVHNCGCSAEQVDQQYLDENGKTPRTNEEAGEDLENHVDKQFRFDPSTQGILPREGHSYFQALGNANDANGSTFGITTTTAQPTKLRAVGLHLVVQKLHEWKIKHHSDHDTITFQCEPLLTNVEWNGKSFHNIRNHPQGFDQLADTITSPEEVWASWLNVKEQKEVLRNYIRGNYVVQTESGKIVNAYLVDNVSRFRNGVIVL